MNLDYATDKARFSYDGLSKGRILEPMIRNPNGQLSSHGWDEILQSEEISVFISRFTLNVQYAAIA